MSDCQHHHVAPTPKSYPLRALDFVGIATSIIAGLLATVSQGLNITANEFYAAAQHSRDEDTFYRMAARFESPEAEALDG